MMSGDKSVRALYKRSRAARQARHRLRCASAIHSRPSGVFGPVLVPPRDQQSLIPRLAFRLGVVRPRPAQSPAGSAQRASSSGYLDLAEHISDRVGVMSLGQIIELGTRAQTFGERHHRAWVCR